MGQGLSDKPLFAVSTYFPPEFGFSSIVGTMLELGAIQKKVVSSGVEKTVLYEELTLAKNGDFVDVHNFEQYSLPRPLRFTAIADSVTETFAFCWDEFINGDPVSTQCEDFRPLYEVRGSEGGRNRPTSNKSHSLFFLTFLKERLRWGCVWIRCIRQRPIFCWKSKSRAQW